MKCQTCNAYIEPNPRGRKKLYCSADCQPYSYKPKGAGLSNCQVCGKDLADVGKPGRPKRNCSNECRIAKRCETMKSRNRKTKACIVCSTEFVTGKKGQRFCKASCRSAHQAEENKIKHANKIAARYPNGMRTELCGWCKEPRTFDIRQSTPTAFHAECTKEAQSARYRIKTVKRQKKTKPYRISHEQVVREYGQDCDICKEPIDLELPRTHRFGLTVDHVIPVNKGGTDSMENLRPAHWICNVKKSDKMPENNDA
jgi:5-methylcytosine-specific restriction endonuclease McrA